jgi:catechol 2,3-dioxygenase-like lactoylglutathione lyase family enzyme
MATVLLRMSHVAVAVRDVERAASDWQKYLGATPRSVGPGRSRIDVGDAFFELHERNGDGVFGLGFDVEDLDRVVAHLRAAGATFTEGERSVCVDPRHTHGVRLELRAADGHDPGAASRFEAFKYVVVAVHHRDAAARDWERFVGLEGSRYKDIPKLGMRRMQFDVRSGMWLALVEPLGEHSHQRRFLAEHPEGVYMVSVRVRDPAQTARELRSRGATIIGDLDGDGPLYVHPRTTHGVLLGLS